MTFIPGNRGFISTANSNTNLTEVAYNYNSGLAVAATSTTITLAATASTSDDTYNGLVMEIILGTGSGQFRIISDYIGATKVATVSQWDTTPDTTSTYIIHRNGGTAQDASRTTITLDGTTSSSTDDVYNNCYIKILAGDGISQTRYIIDYDGTTKVATVDIRWIVEPDSTSIYAIYGESGTGTTPTATTLDLSTAKILGEADDDYNGLYLEIISSSGNTAAVGQITKITDYVESTRRVTFNSLSQTPSGTVVYNIFGGWGGSYESCFEYSQVTATLVLNTVSKAEKAILEANLGFDNTGSLKRSKYTEVSQGVSSVHTLSIITEFIRYKVVGLGTQIGNGSVAGLQVLFHNSKNKALTNFANEVITVNNDTELTKSIVMGVDRAGVFDNIQMDVDKSLNVNITNPRTAFGELQVSKNIPQFQISFAYNEINSLLWEQFTATGGTITSSNSLGQLDITSSIGSYAVLRSMRRVHYRPGQGLGCRFACIFAEPVSLLYQAGGLATSGNGYQIGYNGVDFGVLRAYGGNSEIRKLTISTAANSTETITVTVNGNAVNVSATDASGDTDFTAHQIAETDFSSAGFYTTHVDNTIIFVGIGVGAKNGAYSISSTGAAAGTFSQITAGTAKTDVWTTQPNFNIDKLDGFGPSGLTINPQVGNVYEIDLQWLGFGAIVFKVENPITGDFSPFHIIRYAGANLIPSTIIPSFPFEFTLASLGSTTASTSYLGSSSGYIQGESKPQDPLYSISNTRTGITANTETNVIALYNRREYRGFNNSSKIIFKNLSVSTDLSKTGVIRIYLNPTSFGNDTTTDYDNFQYINENFSTMTYDTNSLTYAGGTLLFSVAMAKVEGRVIDISDLEIEQNQSLLITAESSGTGEATVAITWVEVH